MAPSRCSWKSGTGPDHVPAEPQALAWSTPVGLLRQRGRELGGHPLPRRALGSPAGQGTCSDRLTPTPCSVLRLRGLGGLRARLPCKPRACVLRPRRPGSGSP